MKKLIISTILLIFLFQISPLSFFAEEVSNSDVPTFYTAEKKERETVVYSENNKFGIKDKNGNAITKPIFQKAIMLGRNGYIVQKNNKYGIINSKGEYLIQPKYRSGDRLLGRFAKLGNTNDYGIYNENGDAILPPEYTSIDLLYGKMFLTCKNFRYGVSDFKGNVLIPNICDDIYMPSKDSMKIKYLGVWYEIENVSAEKLAMPDIEVKKDKEENTLKEVFKETGAISGYSVLTFSDYLVKVFSSISPAHEQTIDDLILSHGVDTVGILKTSSWIPKYPVTFAKNYYAYLRNPFNGPFSDTKNKLKNKGQDSEK